MVKQYKLILCLYVFFLLEIQMGRYKSQPDVDTTSEDFMDLTNDPKECKRKLEIYREVSMHGMGKSGNFEMQNQNDYIHP